MNIKIPSNTRDNNYSIRIKSGLLPEFGQIIKKLVNDNIVILTNRTVYKLWYNKLNRSLKSAGIKPKLIVIPDGERYKNNTTCQKIISRMLELGVNRHSALVALGGGVIGDLGGFAASTFMRGIRLIHVPTTLIAQVDSSIGGKVAIDHSMAKNMIGAFYNPKIVLSDPAILETLPKKEYINGLFEVIKISMVKNDKLYDYISDSIDKIINREGKAVEFLVIESARLKAEIIKKDPFEKNLRMILNFGHTFGHALEALGHYKNISHGMAVGWGMILAIQLSYQLRFINTIKHDSTTSLLKKLIGKSKLPKIDPEKVWTTMTLDKKVKNKKVRFVLLKDISKPIIKEVRKDNFKMALQNIVAHF